MPPLPDKWSNEVDLDFWGIKLDVTNKEHMTEKRVNGFIYYSMEVWRYAEEIDFYLWEAFQIDFQGWTQETFAFASDTVIRDLRKFLLTHGVYVVQNRKQIIESIVNVLLQE